MSTVSHLSACLAISLLTICNDRAWPQTISTVKIVVPIAPGGANDFLARVQSAQIGRAQGLAFTIENRTGAGGIIGTEAVSRSAPDGSTVLLHGNSLLIDALVQKTNYHSLTSFEPICNLVDTPSVITVKRRQRPAPRRGSAGGCRRSSAPACADEAGLTEADDGVSSCRRGSPCGGTAISLVTE